MMEAHQLILMRNITGYYQYDESDMEYLMQRRDQNPTVYKNTLYRQVDEDRPKVLSSLLNRASSVRGNGQTTLYNYNQGTNLNNSLFFRLMQNPIIMIIFIVAVSYIISFIGGNLLKMDAGITGLIELVVALVLSYGLSLLTERNSDFIVKGTFIFFISLVILIILIFI